MLESIGFFVEKSGARAPASSRGQPIAVFFA
jgi:hypothetical protein